MPRRRFQFRLRTLFIAVTVLAIVCAAGAPAARIWLKRRADDEWRARHPPPATAEDASATSRTADP